MTNKKTLEVDDFLKITYVSDPQISPNGKYVAMVVIRNSLEENKYINEIWVVDAINGEQKTFFSGEGDTWPRWDPSSKRILFISRRGLKEGEKGNLLYIASVEGGEPRLLLKRKEGISKAAWSPKGDLILFLGPVPRRKMDKDEDYVEIRDLPIWFDSEGFVDQYRNHIFTIDPDSTVVTQLTKGDFNVTYASFSNKGDKIAYVAVTDWRKPLISDIFIIDLKKPEEPLKITKGNMNILSVEWSPDDKYLVFQGHNFPRGDASHYNVWIVPSDGSQEPKNLTEELDRNTIYSVSSDVEGPNFVTSYPMWLTDNHVYFQVSDRGSVGIYRVNPFKEKLEEVLVGDFVIISFTASRDSEKIAYLKMTETSPPEVYVKDKDEDRKITRFNDSFLREINVVKPEKFKFLASDGVEVEGWALPPTKLQDNKKAPVVLFIHGGPKGKYGHAFHFLHQLLANKGFWVVYTNPRGSDGYSEEFADIRGHYGERDYQDIMEAIDYFLKTHPTADPEKMAVTGISYGGYMTNWIVTQTDRFKAAISENGVSDWISDFGTSDIGFWFDPDQIGGDPWKNRKKYERQSPLTYVTNVKTPILLIHSLEDYRCYLDQSTEFYVALRYLGKEARLVIFTKGSHVHSILGKPRHRRKRYQIILEYLKEKFNLKN